MLHISFISKFIVTVKRCTSIGYAGFNDVHKTMEDTGFTSVFSEMGIH